MPDSPDPAAGPDWDAIARDYAASILTVPQLCARYGIRPGLLYKQRSREGWTTRRVLPRITCIETGSFNTLRPEPVKTRAEIMREARPRPVRRRKGQRLDGRLNHAAGAADPTNSSAAKTADAPRLDAAATSDAALTPTENIAPMAVVAPPEPAAAAKNGSPVPHMWQAAARADLTPSNAVTATAGPLMADMMNIDPPADALLPDARLTPATETLTPNTAAGLVDATAANHGPPISGLSPLSEVESCSSPAPVPAVGAVTLPAKSARRSTPSKRGGKQRAAERSAQPLVSDHPGEGVSGAVTPLTAAHAPDRPPAPPVAESVFNTPPTRRTPQARKQPIARRLLTALEKKMSAFEARLAEGPAASAADGERDARTLNTLARLFEKLDKAAPQSRRSAKSDLPNPRQAEELRRDLAVRLEALRQGLVTPPIHPRDRCRSFGVPYCARDQG